tara:strand:+ start:63 stop:536 length:474 start_codon:yes stop_codon:yes gene_type:complete
MAMKDNNNFQRIGSPSNAAVGSDFEALVKVALEKLLKVRLDQPLPLKIGMLGRTAKVHKFDLGSLRAKVVVECKAHTWTATGNSPSAKITTINNAMGLLNLVPPGYQKYLVLQKDVRTRDNRLFAEYYVSRNLHLIPTDVKVVEFDIEKKKLREIPT